MALRLSTTAPAPTPTPSATGPALPVRAAAVLEAGDLAGYRKLFAEAANQADVHERYAMRMALIEAGMAVRRGTVQATSQTFLAVAEETLALLEAEPCEPMMLNHAGVALYELGAHAGARALFEASLRLDPELPHVRSNLDELARRRRTNAKLQRIPAGVLVALRGLEARAARIAGRARPATGLKLSFCMIVRDEESMLERCLASVRDHVDEIVVVDTGSQDRTIEIARSFGAQVIEREWTGSFADARNVAFEACTGDWIFYLDADEVLMEGEGERLRELTGRTWREAFYFVETNHTGELDDGTSVNHDAMRLFRNRPQYRWQGRIHEQIAHTLPGHQGERFERTDLRIEHFGYLGVVREAKDKSRRNLELLERQAAEGVDTPFLHFNLGSERAALAEHPEALTHFRRAWEGVRADPTLLSYGYVPSLAARTALSLRVNGLREELDAHVADALALFPDFTDLVFERAVAARNAGDAAAAEELFERCVAMGDSPSRYSPTVGSGTFLPLCLLAELRRERGDLPGAEALLRRSLDEHPRYLGAVEPLASVLLAQGREPADVLAGLRERITDDSPSLRFLLSIALYEAGAVAEAEAELRVVLARQPHAGPARVALAEALLSQRRWEEAAEVAAEVPAESPIAPNAARSELFARLADEQPLDAVDAALARASEAGMAPDELALFGAWRAIAAGEDAPRVLPAGATPVLFAVLEAFLRVGEDEPFVRLLPLAGAVPVARRDRRELLAQMYLRRGLVDLAAEQWASACHEDGPDAAALAGLAAIAVVRGDTDDAQLFAESAQQLEPGHPGAARVLATLAA